MGCEEIRDLLALYAGGEANEDDCPRVESHVALCASCARDLDQYREARSNLASLRAADLPSGMGKAIWTGVRAELFPQVPTRRLPWTETLLRFAAALLLGASIGVTAHLMTAPTASTPAPFTTPDSFVSSPLPPHRPVPVESRTDLFPAAREKDF